MQWWHCTIRSCGFQGHWKDMKSSWYTSQWFRATMKIMPRWVFQERGHIFALACIWNCISDRCPWYVFGGQWWAGMQKVLAQPSHSAYIPKHWSKQTTQPGFALSTICIWLILWSDARDTSTKRWYSDLTAPRESTVLWHGRHLKIHRVPIETRRSTIWNNSYNPGFSNLPKTSRKYVQHVTIGIIETARNERIVIRLKGVKPLPNMVKTVLDNSRTGLSTSLPAKVLLLNIHLALDAWATWISPCY